MSDDNKVSNLLSKLKESPTFAMSRGGRELFHTNFIAFILDIEDLADETSDNRYAVKVKRKIIESLFNGENKPKNVITFRERSNLDLIVMPALDELKSVGTLVVIEAKLKSIPTNEQLIKYNAKLASGLSLDLLEAVEFEQSIVLKVKFTRDVKAYKVTLYEDGKKLNHFNGVNIELKKYLLAPQSFFPLKPDDEWQLLDWKPFIRDLKTIETDSIDLLDSLIKDYLDSTSSILKLIELVDKKSKKYIGNEQDFSDFMGFSVNHKGFKNARVHDLVGKVTYDILQKKLIESLVNIHKTEGFNLEADTFFSNSTPGFSIYFRHKFSQNDVRIGVQLQGDDYRHFIARDFDSKNHTLTGCAGCIDEWIKVGSENKLKRFNEDRFVYKSTKIPAKFKFDELQKKVEESLLGAIEHISNEKFISKLKGMASP